MTTKQMEYIVELARTGNFNRAAENLYITQPALSYQVSKAEEEVGFQIFNRSGKGAGLTLAGESFVGAIERLLSDYEAAVAEGQRIDPAYADAIRIGMSARVAIPHLAETVDAFLSTHPNIPVVPRFYASGTQQLAERLVDADLLFVPREKGVHFSGWKKRLELSAYEGTLGIASIEENNGIVRGSMPLAADPVRMLLMIKAAEEREEILEFCTMFEEAAR